jgi:hypothetical protein
MGRDQRIVDDLRRLNGSAKQETLEAKLKALSDDDLDKVQID